MSLSIDHEASKVNRILSTICDSDHSQEAAEDKGYSSNENGLQANLENTISRGEIATQLDAGREVWKAGLDHLSDMEVDHSESFFHTTSSRRPDSKVTRFLVTRLQGPLASGVELSFPWWKCENWNESVLKFSYFERCLCSQYSTRG